MDIYIAAQAANEELGTYEQPFAATTTERFDALMRQHAQRGNHVHVAGGRYKTAGIGQWNRRAGRGFTFNGQITLAPDAVVEFDVEALQPYDINSEPQQMFMGQGVWDDPDRSFEEFQAMTPLEVFNALPRGQAVRGGTLIGNFSKAQPIFQAAGQSLRIGGVLCNGHNISVDGPKLLDFGAYRHNPLIGAEAFPIVVAIATSGFDQNKLVQLDMTKYMADMEGEPSHIINTSFDGYVPGASNDQVTVRMILGCYGEPGGFGTGNWKYMWRKDCYQENNVTTLPKGAPNLVQAHTNYLAKRGRIRGNKSYNADVLAYGDYLQTEGQLIELNEAYACRHGIILLLSPGPPVDLARSFYHKDYTIGLNKIQTLNGGAQVLLRTVAADWAVECGKAGVPTTPSLREISGIKVDRSLTVQNEGASLTMVGKDLKKKGGCLGRFFGK